jgi:hypothetical protein
LRSVISTRRRRRPAKDTGCQCHQPQGQVKWKAESEVGSGAGVGERKRRRSPPTTPAVRRLPRAAAVPAVENEVRAWVPRPLTPRGPPLGGAGRARRQEAAADSSLSPSGSDQRWRHTPLPLSTPRFHSALPPASRTHPVHAARVAGARVRGSWRTRAVEAGDGGGRSTTSPTFRRAQPSAHHHLRPSSLSPPGADSFPLNRREE